MSDAPRVTVCSWLMFAVVLGGGLALAFLLSACCTATACNDPRALLFLCAYGHLPPAAEPCATHACGCAFEADCAEHPDAGQVCE
jgi:hypothetical protein